jgi:quercetin dioxygenase-like cupin family protein
VELQAVRAQPGEERPPVAARVVYRLGDDAAVARPGAVTLDAEAICFELVEAPDPATLVHAPVALNGGGEGHLLRCDRVDFPPGGVAYLHTHQGPGARVLLFGSIEVETQGESHAYAPLEGWFEAGPDPVFAAASETEPSAFVRCMILPRRLLGQSSLRYVRPEDAEKPKPQRYRVFVDEPLELPVPR